MLSRIRCIGVLVQSQAVAIGIVVAAATALSAQPVYRLHDNGELWVAKAANCGGNPCVVWHLLDNNPDTREITAGGLSVDEEQVARFDPLKAPPDAPALYQRRANGTIWLYTGKPCSGGLCPGWQQLDSNLAVSIVAAGKQLYQRRGNGEIWSYTDKPCSGGLCPGWQRLDDNSDTIEITAAGRPPEAPRLYQRRKNGDILRYRGTPCSGTSCWQLLDTSPETQEITATVALRSDRTQGHALYERRGDGTIWRYTERQCNGALCPAWEQIDNNPSTISIVTNTETLYQLRKDDTICTIWVYNPSFGPCKDGVCPGWLALDKNTRTLQIAAGTRSLYKRHDNGAIWRYTKGVCNDASCPPWELLYDPTTRTIVSTQH